MDFDPNRLAVLYYFGELQYWKLPQIAVDALESGFDGNSLRRLAGLTNPVASDMRPAEIDAAFREMGVDAPIPRDSAMLTLALETAQNALNGNMNMFDAATHISIYLCELKEPLQPDLHRIFMLSQQAESAPRKP